MNGFRHAFGNLFTRKLDYLYQLLGLQEPDLPVRLGTDVVQPTADILQAAALGRWRSSAYTLTGPIDPVPIFGIYDGPDVISSQQPVDRVLLYLETYRSGGAGNRNLVLRSEDARGGLGGVIQMFRYTIVGTPTLTHGYEYSETAPSLWPIFTPSQYYLTVSLSAIVAGETLRFRLHWFECPEGLLLPRGLH